MNSVDISIFHTVFNITCTVVMLPFAEKLVWISGKLVPGSDQTAGELEGSEAKKMAKRLDSRVLGNPLFALATVVREVSVMGHATCQNLELALAAVSEENPQKAQKVYEREKDINSMEKILTEFLVEVDNLSLTEGQQEQVKNLFYTVSDIERAGDHAENIAELAETLSKNSGSFSKKGKADLELISAQTMQSLQIAVESRETGSVKSANAVRVLEQSVDQLEEEMREKHIRRLSKGKCDPESGVIFLDIISNLERIGDHAVNLAEYGDDMRKWEIDFSDTVKEELNEMKAQCIAALDNLKEVTSENVERILSQAVIIEQKTDDMRDKYFKKQMQRLKKGKCKPQSGIVFSEILTDFERMGDHALNIAQQYREME